jgi:hypothetical protein
MKTTDTKGWRLVAFTFEERRNYPRFPFNAEILIKTAGAAAVLQARTIDLGRMRCRVETDRALPLGSASRFASARCPALLKQKQGLSTMETETVSHSSSRPLIRSKQRHFMSG